MKFFCHIKICDRSFARTTFVVRHLDYAVFFFEPVINYTSFTSDLSLFKLYKVDGIRHSEFNHEPSKLPEDILVDLASQLDKKLEGISVNIN